MRFNVSWTGTLIGVAGSALVLSAAGQRPPALGPFTAEQAAAGRGVFQTNCAFCHGPDLSGGPLAPPLTGRVFADGWSRRTVRELFEALRSMPPTSPGVLGDGAHVNLAAYILQSNGVAPGPKPLTVTATDGIDSLLTSRSSTAATPESSLIPPPGRTCAEATLSASPTARTRSTNDFPRYGGSATNQRYSRLARLTAGNISAIGGAWMARLPGPTSQTAVTMAHGLIFVATMNCK